MTGDAVPQPASCLSNLHRVGDGREPRPEPTELCRNALGVFHMTDCPLTVGLACSYYEAAAAPHPTTGDLDLEAAREEMHRDFLGWRYRRRVRWLTKPKTVVPVGIVLPAQPEPEEVVPEVLATRAPPPDAAPAAAAAPAGAPATGDATTAPVVPAAPAAPERYPGQRRSEERLAKKRARLAALDAAAAAKAAQIAAVTSNPPPDDGFGDDDEGDEDGDDFGADVVDETPADTGPRTVEQILAALPDAPLPVNEPRRHGGPHRGGGGGGGGGGRGGGGGGGGPPRDGQPRRRRRRGRRGGGQRPGGAGGPGGGPGGGPRGGPRGGGRPPSGPPR